MIKNESIPLPTKGGDLVIPPKERRTLRSLKRDECRWPYGDPRQKDFYFCGKQKATGHPYCEFHMRRAFQASRPREYRPHLPRAAA
jgi:GcrA cell cycle regulator